MTDLSTATQDAFIAALQAGVAPSLATVTQHVPDDAQPPLVIVGSIDATAIGGKNSTLEQHQVDVVSIYRGSRRRDLFAIMHAARTALEEADLQAPGAEFGHVVWQRSYDEIADDGVTYQGIQQFEVIVQPADE